MRIPERRDSGILSPDLLHAPKPRLRPHRLDPSFGADASIESFGLAADLLVSLRLGVGDGRRSDSEGRGAGAGGSSGATEPNPNGSATRIGRTQAGTSTRGAEGAARASGCVATRREARVGSGGLCSSDARLRRSCVLFSQKGSLVFRVDSERHAVPPGDSFTNLDVVIAIEV